VLSQAGSWKYGSDREKTARMAEALWANGLLTKEKRRKNGKRKEREGREKKKRGDNREKKGGKRKNERAQKKGDRTT